MYTNSCFFSFVLEVNIFLLAFCLNMLIDGELSFVLMARKDKTSQKPSLKQVQGGLLSMTVCIIMTKENWWDKILRFSRIKRNEICAVVLLQSRLYTINLKNTSIIGLLLDLIKVRPCSKPTPRDFHSSLYFLHKAKTKYLTCNAVFSDLWRMVKIIHRNIKVMCYHGNICRRGHNVFKFKAFELFHPRVKSISIFFM